MTISFMCGIAAVCLLWHSTYPDDSFAQGKHLQQLAFFVASFFFEMGAFEEGIVGMSGSYGTNYGTNVNSGAIKS